jgi:hypothetical protein
MSEIGYGQAVIEAKKIIALEDISESLKVIARRNTSE